MEYKGVLLSKEEKQRYISSGRGLAAIDPKLLIFKKTVFRGPETEVYKLLKYIEQKYEQHNSVKYIAEDIVETSVDSIELSLIDKFPMLKVVAFVLEKDRKQLITHAGVVYIPSGFRYPSKYNRLAEYTFDVIDSSLYGYSKSYMWPILKNPCEEFRVRYKDFNPNTGLDSVMTSLSYKFPYSYEWNDNLFIFQEGEDFYRLDKSISYNVDKKTLKSVDGEVRNVVVPKDVKEIAPEAFKDNNVINKIHLTNVKSIGKEAFANCANLKYIEFSQSLETIGDEAFAWCERLVELVLPQSLKTIGAMAFFKCGVGKVVWPKSIVAIPAGMFRECRNLYEMYIPPEVTSIGRKVFDRSNTVIIYGQPGSVAEQYARENGLYFKPYNFN